ncbi:helix-turn-helix domain-containing protein [Treponema sp.]|uniref:helix-turn-helix domain-containing protein n=1 Tax=Treponema sp. TaxID=166 RepID=UPI00298DAD28|nr:helix-turn-helix domain-containing protein [Treponema sp.]
MKETIRTLREKNLQSQSAIAEYLNISRQMYLKYESGETEPPVKVIVQLAKLYKVPYETIIDNKYAAHDTKSCYEIIDSQQIFSEPSPTYSASPETVSSTMNTLYLSKFESLTTEQKNIVGTLIDSLSSMNKNYKKKGPPYRKPGGLKGEFYMADDFDETPECFKDYM